MDVRNLEANLREEEANLDGAMEAKYSAEANLAGRISERAFARDEYQRTVSLVKQHFIAQQQADLAKTKLDTAEAQVKAAGASVSQREAEIKAAQAKVDNIKADLDDSVLKSPILGRVLYRVAEPGEVLPVGGKIVTLFDLTDVYMTVFVPTNAVGNVRMGDQARIVFDAMPKTPIPAKVSFVSPEAQFTPKQVETATEREKLMFRVKVSLDPQLLLKYKELVKTGVPGVVYFRLDPKAQWPKLLEPPQGL
jgi:HlyD family secretion protein